MSISREDLKKRWHGVVPIDELSSGKAYFGKVIDRRHEKEPTGYDTRIRSNYVNCPYRCEVTHGCQMAIAGFLDSMRLALLLLDYGSTTLRCKI